MYECGGASGPRRHRVLQSRASPVGVKAMQLLSILHKHKCAARTLRPPCACPQPPFPDVVGRGIAGKLVNEMAQKNRDKENTARQLLSHGLEGRLGLPQGRAILGQ